MKKIITILTVGICACLSVMGALNWNTVTNLAAGSTVITSSKQNDAGLIVDDNVSSGWQADPATHTLTKDWVLIDLGEKKTFTDIEIAWEASHCTTYSIYASNDMITYTPSSDNGIEYNKIDQNWLDANQPIAAGGNAEKVNYTEYIELKEAQTAQYILIIADEYNEYGTSYGMYIYEVKLANISDRNAVTSLSLSCDGKAVAGGPAVNVKVTPLNTIGDELPISAVTNLSLTCDNQAVTITGGEDGVFSVSATLSGSYTLTATANDGDKTVTGEMNLTVAYNWDNTENIAQGKPVKGRVISAADNDHLPANAVDGDAESYYQYDGGWSGGEGWLLVDLGDIYNVEAVGALYGEHAAGQCKFGYATDATAIEAKIANDGTDFLWVDPLSDEIGNEWTFSPQIARSVNAVTTYIYDTPVVARYIVVKDADNPSGRPCIQEIYVKGSKREAPKAAEVNLSLALNSTVIGEGNEVTATVFDQYGKEFDAEVSIKVSGADATYADGAVTGHAKGTVTVTATVEGSEISNEVKFTVADENDYCMNGAVITASDGAGANTALVTDGGNPIKNTGEYYMLAPSEGQGPAEHWLLVKLAKPYNIDLISAIWEGACPEDYDIYLGSTAENLTLYYSERGKKGLMTHYDRFAGKEMNDIQYIKIVTTKNATPYGIKLYDLKVYGTCSVESTASKIEVEADNNYIMAGTGVKLTTAVYDQFDALMPDAVVTYECSNSKGTINEENVFTASQAGAYIVTASTKANDGTDISSSVTIDVVVEANDLTIPAEDVEAITLGGTDVDINEVFGPAPYAFNEIPATMVVEFANEYALKLIDIRWEAACPSDYTVEATDFYGNTSTVLTVQNRGFINGYNPIDKIVNSAFTHSAEAATDMGNVAIADLSHVKALTFNITGRNHADYTPKLFGIDAYISEITVSGITEITTGENGLVDVYNLQGIKIRSNVKTDEAVIGLPHGIYIIGGHKVKI